MEIRSYPSFEEMLAANERNLKAAWGRTTKRQKAMLDGETHYVVSYVDVPSYMDVTGTYPFMDQRMVLIYSVLEDVNKREREFSEKVEAGGDIEEEEADLRSEEEYEIKHSLENLTCGLVFGTHASVLCVEGELGTRHISSGVEITKEEYEEAERYTWQLTLGICCKLPYEIQAIIMKGIEREFDPEDSR